MIKALIGKAVLLGLSEVNVTRLKEGKPIKINLTDLGLPDQLVFIMYGETEEVMKEMFKPYIDPEKTVIVESYGGPDHQPD